MQEIVQVFLAIIASASLINLRLETPKLNEKEVGHGKSPS